MVSSQGTSYATFLAAINILDAIAELKQSDTILCDAFNSRLSDRFMKRMGWQPHKPQRWHRNYIKRFYGNYPQSRMRAIHSDSSTRILKPENHASAQ